MRDEAWIEAERQGATLILRAGGKWLITGAAALDRRLEALDAKGLGRVRIDLGRLDALDTVGAWLVLRLKAAFAGGGAEVTVENLATDFAPLLRQAEKHAPDEALPLPLPPPGILDALATVGAWTVGLLREARDVLGFFGLVVVTVLRVVRHPGRVRLVSLISHIERAGVSALPIVGLLSFLIGIVFAYQGAYELRYYGAELFTVNIVGIAFLRELGVILAAIIIAGRSGSAFTAEIGTMQVNEEIDAMRTIGLDPIEVLVLPRLFALVLTLPLIAFYANVAGLVGAALLCYSDLSIPLPAFLQQLRSAVTGWTFWLGILKAPFFAVCIALIGCREGLRVSRSAESVGRLTTLSVVESIFLVIVLDAAFSVLFAHLGI